MRVAALVAALALASCAAGAFRISPEEQLKAEELANLDDMGRTISDGVNGTWLTTNWRGGDCRWSPSDPTMAVCRTATRRSADQPWKPSIQRYRRDEDGDWRLVP